MSASLDPLTEVLELLVAALKRLDEADAPGDIGAHIDHAIQRLLSEIQKMRDADN